MTLTSPRDCIAWLLLLAELWDASEDDRRGIVDVCRLMEAVAATPQKG